MMWVWCACSSTMSGSFVFMCVCPAAGMLFAPAFFVVFSPCPAAKTVLAHGLVFAWWGAGVQSRRRRRPISALWSDPPARDR